MKIFLSYRRGDSEYATSAIYDQLSVHFGVESVFMDVSSIPIGTNFHTYLENWISQCDVVLVIIGESWLDVCGPHGRRLDDPTDWVRVELEAALARDLPIIPVLVGSATMPRPAALPDSLAPIADRQAISIRAGRDFSSHVADLVRALERFQDQATSTTLEKTFSDLPPRRPFNIVRVGRTGKRTS